MNFGPPDRRDHERELVPPDYFRLLTPEQIFADGKGKPLEIDVGCGDGSFLVAMATAHPERNFLGIERLLGRVRKVCRKAKRAGLTNLKVLRLESAYALGWLLPDSSADRIHLLFPDPWPKKRHHKHRFVNPENVDAIHRVLRPGGEFLFKTDHAEYFEWAVDVVKQSGLFERQSWNNDDEFFFYPATDFEQQWSDAGRAINRMRFVNRR